MRICNFAATLQQKTFNSKNFTQNFLSICCCMYRCLTRDARYISDYMPQSDFTPHSRKTKRRIPKDITQNEKTFSTKSCKLLSLDLENKQLQLALQKDIQFFNLSTSYIVIEVCKIHDSNSTPKFHLM